MAKFRKISGVHYRQEGRVKVAYRPGSTIEATEEELRNVDPQLRTWERLSDKATSEVAVETPQIAPVVSKEIEKQKDASLTQTKLTRRSAKKFEAVERGDKKGWDVINVKTKKAINDAPMTREEADTLITDGV